MTDIDHQYQNFRLQIPRLSGESNQTVGFIGPNGAGKTTTIRILMGLLKPMVGLTRVLNEDLPSPHSGIYNQIGYVGEKQGFFYQATCEYNLKVMASFFFNWDRNRMEELIKRLNVPLQKNVSDLSKGNLIKLGLICALSHHPRLLILDEPTSGLDPLVRQELIQILLEYRKKEGSHIFFSSHIIEDMEDMADRLVFISDGKIMADFPSGEYWIFSSSPEQIIPESIRQIAIFQTRDFLVFPSDLTLSPPESEIIKSCRPLPLKELSIKILKSMSYA